MKTPPPEATKTVYPILRQIVNLIPPSIFHAAASTTKDHLGGLCLLEVYGTAGGWKSGGAKPKPLYLQGFLPFSLSPMGQHLAKS